MVASVSVDRRGRAEIVNLSGVSTALVADAVLDSTVPGGMQPLVDAMHHWVQHTRGTELPSRRGGLLDRDRYLSPYTYFGKVRTARAALADDVVGNAADGTEALALAEVSCVAGDTVHENIWNQIAADLNLDEFFRAAWRTLFTDSAFVAGIWWGKKSYKPRGVTEAGNERRKTFDLTVPTALTLLDTTRVVPVGGLAFGQERLCYMADTWEAAAFDAILAKRGEAPERAVLEQALFLGDDVVSRLMVRRYIPDLWEREDLIRDGIDDIHNLFLLDPRAVFRHTLTRPHFRRFPDVRLESCMELLDLKTNLRHSDRTHLIGGANMIILITKGTEAHEADQAEVDNVRANARVLAAMPIVVSDHRLKIEIITPKLDMTLRREKHDTIDSRLFARVWQTFVPTGADANDDPIKLGKVIGRGLEGRRRMMKRTVENKLFEQIRALNEGGANELSRAKVRFTPANVTLAFDSAWAGFLLDLFELGSVSRETTLGQFDMDQDDEAMYRDREAKDFDHRFRPLLARPGAQAPDGGGGDQPALPPGPATRTGGRRGGNRNGGGAAPGTNQGQTQSPEQIRRRGRRQRTTDAEEDGEEQETEE
jgi:hypothetical protein